MEDNFPRAEGEGRGDGSGILQVRYIYCAFYFYYYYISSPRVLRRRYWRLRTPALWEAIAEFTELSVRLPVCLPRVTPPDSQQLEGTKEGQGTLKMLRSAMHCVGVVKEDFTEQT